MAIQELQRNSKFCLRPSNMFSVFIEIYSSIVEAILKYYWRVLNVILKKSLRIIFLQLFST
jgi:hypothetical protein